MVITWDDVGRTESPGWVTVDGMTFRVEQTHIDLWQANPHGIWTLKEFRLLGEPSQWVLSRFGPTADPASCGSSKFRNPN